MRVSNSIASVLCVASGLWGSGALSQPPGSIPDAGGVTAEALRDAGAATVVVEQLPGQAVDASDSSADGGIERIPDSKLYQAWDGWRAAVAAKTPDAELKARTTILELRERVRARSFEAFAMGWLNAAFVMNDAGDSAVAMELGEGAVQLAPRLPAAWFELARLYLHIDPSRLGRVVEAFGKGLSLSASDRRFSSVFFANLAYALMFAAVIAAAVVVLVLCLKKMRYFVYDFHFLFPRFVARWQSAVVAVALVVSPVIVRAGLIPVLLALFAAATVYLAWNERIAAAVCIALVASTPLIADQVVRRTNFVGTAGERLAVVEQGGPGAEAAAVPLKQAVASGSASFAERFVLGHLALRRGDIADAAQHFRAALDLRPNDARATNNLALAMLAEGDLENPWSLFANASKTAPDLAAPQYNYALLAKRRYAAFGDSAAGDVDRGNAALAEAVAKDPSLAARSAVPHAGAQPFDYVTASLSAEDVAAAVSSEDAAQAVRGQLTSSLAGYAAPPLGLLYPFLAALAIACLGALSRPLEVAVPCNKCGRPVSRRGDPELPRGSSLCTQCVNVFSKKGVVSPTVKVQKQIEVARYQQRQSRIGYLLGFFVSGAGHAFRGRPLRAIVHGYIFFFCIWVLLSRSGFLRPEFPGFPLLVVAAPLLLLFVINYVVSARHLLKR